MAYQSVNPNTGKVLKFFEPLSDAQLETSLAAAESCFQTWKHKSFAERAVTGSCRPIGDSQFDEMLKP